MDILRKELNAIYEAQHLNPATLDRQAVAGAQRLLADWVRVSNACMVLTDASADSACLFTGHLGQLLGLTAICPWSKTLFSADEDLIYNRLHPEDLVEKRMLEYEFFKYVDALPPADKLSYKATCRLRILDADNRYVVLDNSTQVLRLSPEGTIWLILCCYDLSSDQQWHDTVCPAIRSNRSGEVRRLSLADKRTGVLTRREKQILLLIKEGKLSKEIAACLDISVHTVNRHRQNILEKLSVGNSLEAIRAASSMKLL